MLVKPVTTSSLVAATRSGVLLPRAAASASASASAALSTSTSVRAQPASGKPTSAAPSPSRASSSKKKAALKPASLPHNSQLSPSAPPPSEKPYSPITVAVVKGLAKLMGYNSTTSTAIRVTSDLYDRCAERAHVERNFWYADCALPETYQSWFQITNLHIYLLMTRFRAFDRATAHTYSQELINHFFIDAESRMRDRFGVQTSRLVKGYMKDMHMQHRGSVLGFDEGLVGGDVRLAQAVWRNIWGAGWGTVAGVKRKLAGVDKIAKGETEDLEGQPDLAKDLASLDPSLVSRPNASAYARAATASLAADRANAAPSTLPPQQDNPATMPHPTYILPALDPLAASNPELAFPQHLHRIVRFIRRESLRLANISDSEIILGHLDPNHTPPPSLGSSDTPPTANTSTSTSIAAFSRI